MRNPMPPLLSFSEEGRALVARGAANWGLQGPAFGAHIAMSRAKCRMWQAAFLLLQEVEEHVVSICVLYMWDRS